MRGREQALATAQRIVQQYQPARIVASPYVRAWQTAEIIAAVLRLEVESESDLREQNFGVFAGQPYDALLGDAAYHDGPRWHWRPSGGESLMDVYERVVPVFERVARDSAGSDVVLVSHGGVMLALCAFVSGSWDGITVTPNAGIVVIQKCGDRFTPPLMIADHEAD